MRFNVAAAVAFIIGQLLFMLKRADTSVKSHLKPDVATIGDYFRQNWINLLIRLLVADALTGLLVVDPTMVSGWLTSIGITVSWSLPDNPAVRFLLALPAGLASDFGLDWVATKSSFFRKLIGEKSGLAGDGDNGA